MRTKNQETLDRILKFVNKYYQEHHSSPTINDVAEGVGVARSTTHRYLQELSDRNLIDYSRGILSAPQSAKMKTAYVSAPLVGSIRCGNPEDEEESIEEYVSLPVSMFGKGDFYILRAKGDSMVDAAICDGDYVVVREQNSAVNGDIVAALLDDEATVKTFRKENGHVWLMPHNPAYSPIDGTHATIMGKAGHRAAANCSLFAPADQRAPNRAGRAIVTHSLRNPGLAPGFRRIRPYRKWK